MDLILKGNLQLHVVVVHVEAEAVFAKRCSADVHDLMEGAWAEEGVGQVAEVSDRRRAVVLQVDVRQVLGVAVRHA